jgi:dipeptidyl aminopeptidase/acylaminoacyl peptidase
MDAEGAVTQLTRLTESPSGLQWSPDGKWIAFSMFVPKRDNWSIAMPAPPRGARWTEPPRIVQKLNYRRDGSGFVEDGSTHIFVVSADGGGTPRQVTSGDFNHGSPRWTADGKALLFSGLRVPNAEYHWRESEIYSVDVASGEVKQLTSRKGPDGNPTPSPDGRFIAYTGYDSTSDTWIDSKLYVMNADGSGRREISGTLDRSPQGLMWAPDNSGVYFNAENEGARNLYFASLSGNVRQVTRGANVLSVSDIARNGVAVGTMSTGSRPNDVVSFTLANPQPAFLTAVNEDILYGKKVSPTEEIWYTSVDGFRIQGWVVKPPDFDPRKKYPLILEIHGGPHSMYNLGFNFARQTQAADGYVVLYTNPRGSTGYGSRFGNAIKNAYPGKDYDDLMAGVDTVINRGYIDTQNLFVHGCSGGGVLTAWIVGHTNRFTAASSNCPVINWMSFVGTTDGSSWYNNFEKHPWDDPSEHLRRSPLMYVGNVTTPTMLMTGVNDLRTPISQTEEFYEALKVRKVPTAMIRFNDEWHGTSSKPSNYLRTQLYLRSWFERWAKKPAITP